MATFSASVPSEPNEALREAIKQASSYARLI